jgi:hypothetical protein
MKKTTAAQAVLACPSTLVEERDFGAGRAQNRDKSPGFVS